jgi:hypothetical protein
VVNVGGETAITVSRYHGTVAAMIPEKKTD